MRNSSTVLHRLYLWSLDHPEAAAQVFKRDDPNLGDQRWQTITAKSFWLQVVRIALFLQSREIKKGDRVCLYAMNSPEWIQWELGTWLAGCVSVGIHPSTTAGDLESILRTSNPKIILAESEVFRERLSGGNAAILLFSEARVSLIEAENKSETELNAAGETLLNALDPKAAQLVVFTSGTSGTPKGVLLGLNQLTFVADTLGREWNLPYAEGVLFSFLPLSHIAEKIQAIAVAITQRYPVWFNTRYEHFADELKEVRPTMLLAVPLVWEKIKEQVEARKPKLLRRLMEFDRLGALAEKLFLSQVKEQLGLDRLTLAVSGAAKLPPSIGKWFSSLQIEIQEIYGMSESCGLISLTSGKRAHFSRVGKAPYGIEIKITSEGEIWFRGENVFLGYDQDPDETAAVLLEEGWVKTGDLGEWVPNDSGEQELHIIGRNREIIKLSNGRMVAPVPIENAIKELEEVANVCVVGEGRSHLLALITLHEKFLIEYKFVPGAIEGLSVEDETIKAKFADKLKLLFEERKIRDRIPKFVILSREFSIDQNEMTATQKLNRNQIQKNFRYFIDLAYEN